MSDFMGSLQQTHCNSLKLEGLRWNLPRPRQVPSETLTEPNQNIKIALKKPGQNELNN